MAGTNGFLPRIVPLLPCDRAAWGRQTISKTDRAEKLRRFLMPKAPPGAGIKFPTKSGSVQFGRAAELSTKFRYAPTCVNGSAISTTFSTGSANPDSIQRLATSTTAPMMPAISKGCLAFSAKALVSFCTPS